MKVGDKILTVNGHRVADMSYNEWKNSMDEALKQGALLMDVRRQGRSKSQCLIKYDITVTYTLKYLNTIVCQQKTFCVWSQKYS